MSASTADARNREQQEESERLGRAVPQDVEAESSVLGSVLLDARALERVIEYLRPEDFYRMNNGLIFGAMLALSARSQPVDSVTVAAMLGDDLGRCGGHAHLAMLQEGVPTSANIVHYATIVREKSLRRKLISAGAGVAALGWEEAKEISEALNEASSIVFGVREGTQDSSTRRGLELLKATMERIESGVRGVPSGFADYDYLTNGLYPTELTILAGRPGMGKTSLAISIALSVVMKKIPVLFISLEMSAELIMQRMLCQVARIDSQRLRKNLLSERESTALYDAIGQLETAPMIIEEPGSMDELMMLRKTRHFVETDGIGAVFIDYLGLISGSGRKENRLQEVSSVARTMKQMARELKLPVIAACQLNRAAESRGPDSKRPTLSDLRESGEIEQAADVVVGLYNEGYYDKTKSKRFAEAILLKHRNGPMETVNLGFDETSTAFFDTRESKVRVVSPPFGSKD